MSRAGSTIWDCAGANGGIKTDLARLQALLEGGEDVDKPNWAGCTPLHCASPESRPDIVKFLLRKGANPNHKTPHGMTPLHFAAYYARAENVKALMNAGADVSIVTQDGELASDKAREGAKAERGTPEGYREVQSILAQAEMAKGIKKAKGTAQAQASPAAAAAASASAAAASAQASALARSSPSAAASPPQTPVQRPATSSTPPASPRPPVDALALLLDKLDNAIRPFRTKKENRDVEYLRLARDVRLALEAADRERTTVQAAAAPHSFPTHTGPSSARPSPVASASQSAAPGSRLRTPSTPAIRPDSQEQPKPTRSAVKTVEVTPVGSLQPSAPSRHTTAAAQHSPVSAQHQHHQQQQQQQHPSHHGYGGVQQQQQQAQHRQATQAPGQQQQQPNSGRVMRHGVDAAGNAIVLYSKGGQEHTSSQFNQHGHSHPSMMDFYAQQYPQYFDQLRGGNGRQGHVLATDYYKTTSARGQGGQSAAGQPGGSSTARTPGQSTPIPQQQQANSARTSTPVRSPATAPKATSGWGSSPSPQPSQQKAGQSAHSGYAGYSFPQYGQFSQGSSAGGAANYSGFQSGSHSASHGFGGGGFGASGGVRYGF